MNRLRTLSRSVVPCLAVVLAMAAAAPASLAQTFPTKPVALVVPYPPGGTADILARAVGQKLGDKLGQAVIIENKAGAGTAIGARFVAEAAPDGYTMLMGTVSSHAINPAMTKVGYDPVRDFATVAALGSIPFVLVTRPDSPYKTLADVIAAAKREPGKIGYASAGPGTSNHLAGEMLATAAGVQLLHVPYKGSAPALTDVLAGHVPLMFDLVTTAVPNLKQGKLKALAVTGASRSPLLPDVPTVAESGLAGFEVSAWFALFAPSKVPAPVLKRLSDDTYDILRTPEMQARLRELGMDPDSRTADAFSTYVRSEATKYGAVVKQAGLAP